MRVNGLSVLGKGVFRNDRYELPPDGLRELVVNAFAHRNYFDHDAPVFVAVYDTRVEITSPGGLPRGLTVEKAISGCSKIRNKAIAEALSYMRYVEGWGSGLLRVNEELVEYGARPVALEDVGIATRMNVYRVAREVSMNMDDGGGRKSVEPNEPNREPNVFKNTTELVLDALVKDTSATIPKLMDECKVSRETVKRAIKTLKESGRIRRNGGTRGTWQII